MSKVALVVGGTGGLGAGCAEDLAKDHIVIVTGRNKERGDAVVDKITSAGGKAAFKTADITDPKSVAALHQAISNEHGRLDVAINAGGILSSFVKLADTAEEDFDRVMAVNVKGTYLCMQQQIKLMLQNPDKAGGSIINFSSIYGLAGTKWGSIYSTSKHAIVGMTRSAALEYALNGIRINAVAPGIIPTDMTASLDPSTLPEGEMRDDIADLINHYPQRRVGEVADCTRSVRYLVESPWSTGTVIEIDGGFGAQ